jgi:Raf kinase inhibitor-like YbhB/YbcL family protein
MKRKLLMLGAGLALGVLTAGAASAAKLSVTSPDIASGKAISDEQVFNGFGCSGKNVSPALSWSGAPAGTKSFAVTVYDPDAPTGSGFWHWVVFNIPPSTTSLPKNAGDVKANLAPKGSVQSRTDFGVPGWGGPCPPPGKAHRYIFTVFAVDVDHIDATADTSAAVIGFNLHFHTLAKGSLTGKYGRSK